MPAFRYQAYTVVGQLEVGVIEATSRADAVRLLNERGLLPFKTEATADTKSTEKAWLSTSMFSQLSLIDYAELARDLSVLLGAGLPLDHALRLMSEETSGRPMRRLLHSLLESVTAGAALSVAFEQHATSAPAYIASLIRAGEARGSLGPTLADVADFLQKRAEIQTRIRSALTYPVVLAVTALITVVLITIFLVPAILPLFSDAGIEPPLPLTLAQRLGDILSTSWPGLLVLLVISPLLTKRLLTVGRVRRTLDRLILRLPLVGKLVSKINVAILARTLGTLLRNGVSLVPALRMTASVVSSRPFSDALDNAAQGVREGQRLTQIFASAPVIPKLMIRFVTIGEEASKLDDMLLHLADMSEADSLRNVDRLMTLLPPLFTIAIGVLVGGLVLSVMQAITSVNQLVLQ